MNSAVSAMSIMYVSCNSGLGHLIHVSDLRLVISKIRWPRKFAGHGRAEFKSLSDTNPLGMMRCCQSCG